MKLVTVGLGAICALALSAGMAAAEMQPIPNPPEKPKAAAHKHKATHHKAKPAAEQPAADQPAEKAAEPAKK